MDYERLLTAMQNILDNGLNADSFFELREAAAEYQPEPPAPQIIRTVEELEALDIDSWLAKVDDPHQDPLVMILRDWESDYEIDRNGIFPLVVLATGAQVRAARKALGGA